MASSATTENNNDTTVMVSNIPSVVTTAFQLTSFINDELSISVVECYLHVSLHFARVVLSSVDHVKLLTTLDGTIWHGSSLSIQPWTLSVQPTPKSSSDDMYTNAAHTNKLDYVSNAAGGNTPSRHRFIVQRAECTVFIRKVPHSVSSEELSLFVQKRIQLAYKMLTDDIVILSCHIICKGDGSLNQACMEFSQQRVASMALNLRTKTLQGQPLDILAWEDRSSKINNTLVNQPSTESFEDESSVSTSSGDVSEHHRCEIELKPHHSKKPYAVYVGNLPEETTGDELSMFLIEMFVVAYKERPTIIHCSIRGKPHNDAYVEFKTQEEVNRAIYLRNRTLGGRKIAIVGWDHTFKLLGTKNIENKVSDLTTESRDDSSMEKASIMVTGPTGPSFTQPTANTVRSCVSKQLESSGLASILNQSFFDYSNRESTEIPTLSIPHRSHESITNANRSVHQPPLSIAPATPPIALSTTMNAGIPVYRRRLDAARLENQGSKQSSLEAQPIVQLEEVLIDRDKWKKSCIDVRTKLKETISELGSCRTAKEHLEEEVAKLKDQLEVLSGLDESKKKRKSNESFPIDENATALTLLKTQLADTEKRFKAVTESLTQQSMIVHETIQENRELRTMLEKERALRTKAEQNVHDR